MKSLCTLSFLVKAALLTFLSFFFAACDKEDEKLFDKEVMFGKQWYIHSGTINETGTPEPMTIIQCRKDDSIEFQPDEKLIFLFGTEKCNAGEPDVWNSTWSLDEKRKSLTMDNSDYEILALSSSGMDLRRILKAGSIGSYIVVEYFYRVR